MSSTIELYHFRDLHDISDCELVKIAVSDWSYFLLKLIDDRKIVEKDVLKRQVEVKAMRSKPLEVTVAVMINKTYEEYVYRSNFLPYVHKYCIDQGIMFEELLEDLWQDVKDALFQLSDPQFDITPVNAIRNLTNFIGNFHNKGRFTQITLLDNNNY